MEDTLILQVLSKTRLRVVYPQMKEIESHNKYDIQSISRNKKYLSLITSLHTPQDDSVHVIKEILKFSEIEGIISSIPSTLSTFAMDTHDIFYVELESDNPEVTQTEAAANVYNRKINCKIEIITDAKLDNCNSRVFEGGLEETVHNTFNLLSRHSSRTKLAANIFINCEDEDLKRKFQEKMVMDVCGSSNNKEQIKYLKFIKLPSYVKDGIQAQDHIKNDPVLIGAWLTSKIRFYETRDFSTRREFFSGEYKELSIH